MLDPPRRQLKTSEHDEHPIEIGGVPLNLQTNPYIISYFGYIYISPIVYIYITPLYSYKYIYMSHKYHAYPQYIPHKPMTSHDHRRLCVGRGGGRLGQSAFARAHGATQQQRSAPGDGGEMVGNISTGNPLGKQWGWETTTQGKSAFSILDT